MSENPLIPDPEEQAEQILADLRENFDVSDEIEPEHLIELIDPEKHTWQNFRTVAESLFLVEPKS